jgi:hypothetical protein
VNPTQIAENGYTGHVLAMKGKHTRRLLAQPRCSFWRGYLPMQVLVLLVIRGRYLCKQAGHHLDDICNWHLRYLILGRGVVSIVAGETGLR